MWYSSNMIALTPGTDLRSRLLDRIDLGPDGVWAPCDFVDPGSRAAMDKTLQRLVAS